MSDYITYYAIIAGISIIAYWINYLRKSKLNNTYIKTHIIAEITTAAILIYSVFTKSTVLIPLSFGMLLYATINIVGEYILQVIPICALFQLSRQYFILLRQFQRRLKLNKQPIQLIRLQDLLILFILLVQVLEESFM